MYDCYDMTGPARNTMSMSVGMSQKQRVYLVCLTTGLTLGNKLVCVCVFL